MGVGGSYHKNRWTQVSLSFPLSLNAHFLSISTVLSEYRAEIPLCNSKTAFVTSPTLLIFLYAASKKKRKKTSKHDVESDTESGPLDTGLSLGEDEELVLHLLGQRS